ncbi:MAG: hypothetical protein ACM3YM_13350 [Sphingomonadales bacterium]
MLEGLSTTFASIAVVAAMLLVVGGIRLVRRRQGKGWLMLVAALVLVANVLIWTWPA